jgi:hypothetical protein
VRVEFDFSRVTIRTLIWAESGTGPFFIGCLEFFGNTMTPEVEEHQEILSGDNVRNLGSSGVSWAIPGLACYRREIVLS